MAANDRITAAVVTQMLFSPPSGRIYERQGEAEGLLLEAAGFAWGRLQEDLLCNLKFVAWAAGNSLVSD